MSLAKIDENRQAMNSMPFCRMACKSHRNPSCMRKVREKLLAIIVLNGWPGWKNFIILEEDGAGRREAT